MSIVSSLIPPQWKIAATAVAAVLVIGGSFGYGWHLGDVNAAKEIAAFKVNQARQTAKVQQGQAKVNTQVITKYVPKVQKVIEWRTRNAEAVAKVPDSKYVLSSGWVRVHDASAAGLDLDPSAGADAAPSGVTPDQALDTVTFNYTQVCEANADQLRALQAWIRQTNANVKKTVGDN